MKLARVYVDYFFRKHIKLSLAEIVLALIHN